MKNDTIILTQEIKINQLEAYPMHIIRVLGRQMGVKSPTSKRTAEIIKEIREIFNGEKEPYYTVAGRKPKNIYLSYKADENDVNFSKYKLNKVIEEYEETIKEIEEKYENEIKELKNKIKEAIKN